MCLAIPGKIISIDTSKNGELKTAVVDFGGVFKNICIEWIDAIPGEYILAHAGVALTKVNMTEAEETLKDLEVIAHYNESEKTKKRC